MSGNSKLKASVLFAAFAVAMCVGYNMASEYMALPDYAGYLERRSYYEQNISTRGLSMHKARHWRKAQ